MKGKVDHVHPRTESEVRRSLAKEKLVTAAKPNAVEKEVEEDGRGPHPFKS